MGPEARLSLAVRSSLKLALGNRGLVVRMNSGSLVIDAGTGRERRVNMGTPGFPDLMVIMRGGRILFIELKAPKGRVTDKQAAMHDRLEELGHRVVVARDVASAVGAVQQELRKG